MSAPQQRRPVAAQGRGQARARGCAPPAQGSDLRFAGGGAGQGPLPRPQLSRTRQGRLAVREYQRKTTQWDMGKNFDRTGGFGPWMVTADELPAGGKALKIQTRLNGQVMQSDNTDNMMFPVAETIAYVTQGMTLEPGDIVFTGTPSGVGHARKPNPVWMKPGDTCEIDIEGVGVLVNPIENEK